MIRIAVTSRSFSKNQVLRKELEALYPNVTYNISDTLSEEKELIEFLRGHDKAIIALNRVNKNVLKALPELKVIAKYGVGLDQLDLNAMIELGVRLGWYGGVNRRSVSELVIGFAIMLLRNVISSCNEVQNGHWRQIRGRQLSDCTVGIIGCGHIGKDVGKILREGFNCRVLAHDIEYFHNYFEDTKIIPVPLEKIIAESDIITLHLPYDPTTKNILNADRLKNMKKNSILINTARSGLVDEAALKNLLKAGHISGAAFDVFSVEPPDDADLWSLQNFILTPHIGGSTSEAILSMGRAAIRGLKENDIPKPGVFPEGF